jgi:type II secretory pathway pseudopilin PulG
MFLNKDAHNSAGYTLIQMAMALIVIGVILASFLSVYTQYQIEEKSTKTVDNVNSVISSIQKYRNVFGTFPCPAPMNVARTDATYGIASAYDRYLATGAVPVVAGDCAEGICIENNVRNDLPGPPTYRVRVGAIPFRDMQLDEATTYDAYGSRLWYAVTEDMCNLPTFNETRGAINILNDQGETQTVPANAAAFIVISPGINKVGAYGYEGNAQVACGGSIDSENCRDVSLATSATTTATYLTQFTQDATAATTYDDVLEFFSSAQTQLWRRSAPGSEHIMDMANNSVGIGESSPSATLDIAQSTVSTLAAPTVPITGTAYRGTMLTTNQIGSNREHGALRVGPPGATGSQLQADAYCNEGGTNCFKPENIMTSGINCPSGTYPVGITSNAVSKNAEFTCTPIAISCPAGQTFAGFNNSSGILSPNCSSATSFASCAATTRTLCSTNDVSLPLSAHNLSWVYRSAGSCRMQYYRCNNGTWEDASTYGYPIGSCVNTPTVTSNIACNTGDNCWSGTYSSTTFACGGGSDTRATDCLCNACSTTSTASCADPFTGTGATTRFDYVCPGPTPQTPHVPAVPPSVVTVAASCSCSLTPYNAFYNCPTGFIRSGSAPVLTPNNWPSDIFRGRYELVNVSGSCTHVPSGSVVDHCTCNTSDTFSTLTPSPPNTCREAQSGSRIVNSTSYDWKYDVYRTTINATTCTPNAPTLESAAQFQNVNTFWREIAGTYISTVDTKPPGIPVVNEPCDCASNAPPGSATGSCVKANNAGKWDSYQCRCDR